MTNRLPTLKTLRAKSRKGNSGASVRQGIAVVELAVTLPVIAIFVFSLLQLSNIVFLKQKLTAACYIGMQQIAQRNANEKAIIDSLQALLKSRGIQNSTVEISPAGVLDTASVGTQFSLRVSAPYSRNVCQPQCIPMSGSATVEQWIYR